MRVKKTGMIRCAPYLLPVLIVTPDSCCITGRLLFMLGHNECL
jgi:hypothetical protein